MNDLQQLFPVTAESFSAPSVDGRKLHDWLEVKSNFTTWAKRIIENLDLTPGGDFLTSMEESSGGRPAENYRFTVDVAKMVAMATRTHKGGEVRRYFVECERQLLERPAIVQPVPMLPAQIAEQSFGALLRVAEMAGAPKSFAVTEAAKIATQQSGIDLLPMANASQHTINVPVADVVLEPTELGEALGYGQGKSAACAVNQALAAAGLQEKVGRVWVATESGAPMGVRNKWVVAGKSGYNIAWRIAAVRGLLATTT